MISQQRQVKFSQELREVGGKPFLHLVVLVGREVFPGEGE